LPRSAPSFTGKSSRPATSGAPGVCDGTTCVPHRGAQYGQYGQYGKCVAVLVGRVVGFSTLTSVPACDVGPLSGALPERREAFSSVPAENRIGSLPARIHSATSAKQ
jgi:hypothetical protein